MRSLLVLALLAACHHPAPAPAPAPKLDPLTGPLSEEQFKALHQLRGDHSPAPTGQMIDLAGGRAYLSLPPGAHAPMPAIVVVHEWWGLNEHIEHWADRLAGLGYAALAVDLYGGQVATDADTAMKLMKSVDATKAHAILDAAVQFLTDDPRIQATKRGVIGWCFGGGWSLQTALAHPDLDAVVMYYGMPVNDPAQLKPLQGQLLGIFANKDTFITPDLVNQFEGALKTAGVRATILRYDADHAFANPSGPHYDEPSAADAWAHVVDFLGRTLGATGSRSADRAPAASRESSTTRTSDSAPADPGTSTSPARPAADRHRSSGSSAACHGG
jgi:carboxymethylenebutenolidase